jgi:hypothetical protein
LPQELKDTVTKIMSGDIKQKLFDSLSSTFNAVYSMAVGNTCDASSNTVQQVRAELMVFAMAGSGNPY